MQITQRSSIKPQVKPYILLLILGFTVLFLQLCQPFRDNQQAFTETDKKELAQISREQPFVLFQAIPINSADHKQLMSIPGVGPALAGRIIDYREESGEFGNLDELLQVNGIGPQKLKLLKKYCCL